MIDLQAPADLKPPQQKRLMTRLRFIFASGFQACDAHFRGQAGPDPYFVQGLLSAGLTIAKSVRG